MAGAKPMPAASAADRINYINIGLMAVAWLAAFAMPFEVFLLAYGVLGPLHYLTEISWIHDRKYFLDKDRPRHAWVWLALVGLALAAMLVGLVSELALHTPLPPTAEIGLFYVVMVSAALFAFRAGLGAIGLGVALTGVAVLLFASSPLYGLIAFLVITIIHVLVFTAAFILSGALKTKSLSALASLGVFAVCVASFLIIRPEWTGAPASAYIQNAYDPFNALNAQLIRLFQLGPTSTLAQVYDSSAGRAVMRLIAFAYTYHYLNWFSKTSVIKWHQISRPRAGVILLLWIAAVGVYAWNFRVGFAVLYLLSVLHVMLELPLNHLTFAGIGSDLMAFMGPPRPAPVAARASAKRQKRRRQR